MFKSTSRQRGLFEPETQLSDAGRRRLVDSWAEQFRQRVYPVLLASEEEFSGLYDAQTGRPTWSVARMLGLVVLRESRGLPSDQATVDALMFDTRWQHALGVCEASEASLSKRSLVDFRLRLRLSDPDSERLTRLFERIGEAAIRDLGVKTSKQRLDSTFVQSNIARRGQLALLNEALRALLRAAKKSVDAYGTAPVDAREWYERAEGWGRTLNEETSVEWLRATLQALEPSEVSSATEYVRAKTVFAQHTTLGDDGPLDPDEPPSGKGPASRGKGPSRRPKGTGSSRRSKNKRKGSKRARRGTSRSRLRTPSAPDSIQSLHDPDANRGRKGLGYQVQISETCGNETTEILTSVQVQPANASDQTVPGPLLRELASRGCKPDVLLVDAGYTSGRNLLEARSLQSELVGPVAQCRANDLLSRADFSYDQQGRVLQCPQGHAPLGHTTRTGSSVPKPTLHVTFERSVCDACPERQRCPVRSPPEGRRTHLNIALELRAHDERQREQQSPEWRAAYALRSGIEATNSEMKRAHGLGRLPVRGLAEVRRRAILKAIGCNAKRWCRAAAARTRAGSGTDRDAAGADGPGPNGFAPSLVPSPPVALRAPAATVKHHHRDQLRPWALRLAA